MKKSSSFTVSIVLVLFILGILISVLIKSLNSNQLRTSSEGQDLARLLEEAMALVRENNALAESNRQLSELLDAMRQNMAGEDAALQALIDERNQAEAFAGLTDLEGPGIQIVLNAEEVTNVHGHTLLLLINELRTSGALAISVNDERIVALTEIRETGVEKPELVINGNSYPASVSYTVRALYTQQDKSRGMQLLSELLELMKKGDSAFSFSLTESEALLIPKLDADSLGNR